MTTISDNKIKHIFGVTFLLTTKLTFSMFVLKSETNICKIVKCPSVCNSKCNKVVADKLKQSRILSLPSKINYVIYNYVKLQL